jgi:uncharacterized membrane protein
MLFFIYETRKKVFNSCKNWRVGVKLGIVVINLKGGRIKHERHMRTNIRNADHIYAEVFKVINIEKSLRVSVLSLIHSYSFQSPMCLPPSDLDKKEIA